MDNNNTYCEWQFESIMGQAPSTETHFVFRNADALDIFFLTSIIVSMVISALILIFFVRKYYCQRESIRTNDSTGEVLIGPSPSCLEINRVGVNEYFDKEDADPEYTIFERSASSSMDRGYLADYIECNSVHQQSEKSYRLSYIEEEKDET